MTTYRLVDDLIFTKTAIEPGRGLNAPNEGSTCRVIINFLFSPTDYELDENLYVDLLPLNIEQQLTVGFYSSVISNYVHKCLITMKQNEICHLSFNYPDENHLMMISIHLISFERYVEIYSMSMNDLYTFALKHKENANKFFQDKHYLLAFRLYHRSLSYLLNFINEEPSDEHKEHFERCHQLASTIYSNMAACQLINGNHSGVIENCSSALEINPKFVKALYRRASAYANRNDFELALNDLRLAEQIEPNDQKIDELTKQTKQRFEQYKKTMSNSLKNFF